MDNPRPEKVAVVDEVRQHFDSCRAAILTEYRGLKVKDLADLRRSLRPNGGEYRIYKNTLVTLAAREVGLADLEPMLEGPTAIAFVKDDAAAVAKALRDFSRAHPLLVIKGGVLGDKVIGPPETNALAELPPRDVLLAQFAGALAAPLQQLAGLLQALPRNLAYGLAALRDKRQDEGGGPPAESAESAEPGAPAADATAPDEAASEEGASDEAAAEAQEAQPVEPQAAPADTPTASTETE